MHRYRYGGGGNDVEKLELRALALPGQKIVVVPTLQSMADHSAIAKASATAAGGADTTGAHVTRRRPRVHGARPLEELRSARDVLTQGLRQAVTATSEGNARKAAALLSEGGDVDSLYSGGAHVLPVYLSSCAGLPRGTAMGGESLVASAPDAADPHEELGARGEERGLDVAVWRISCRGHSRLQRAIP